jgi:hypothetical protein
VGTNGIFRGVIMYQPINGFTKQTIKHKIQTEFTDKSLNDIGGCVYRGMDGRKCIVGCFIPDEMYEPEMDKNADTSVTGILKNYPDLKSFMPLELEALKDLQHEHDEGDYEESVTLKEHLLDWVEKYVENN